jgi:hypothetical protein
LELLMVRLVRWLTTLGGGVLIGAGLVLHGQVAIAHYMREEVEKTFFLWRAIGQATVFLQGNDVRMAFALREVPRAALQECEVAAWTLIGVGAVLALTAPLLHRRQPARSLTP